MNSLPKGIVVAMMAMTGLVALAEAGDALVVDKGGVYEVDATAGLTLSDFSASWTNAFLKSTDTFVFKGSGEKGMELDFKTPILTTPYTNQFSHLVFDGGVQTYGWAISNAVNATTTRLATGATRENPAITVKSGTLLRFFNRTYRGGNGGITDRGAWIEVEDGATLQMTNDVFFVNSSPSYYQYPTILHPGATLELSHPPYQSPVGEPRTTFVPDTLFYVPETTPGDTRMARINIKQAWVYFGSPASGKLGLGFSVGANATLQMEGMLHSDSTTVYRPLCKYGPGTLVWNCAPETNDRRIGFIVKAGKLIYEPQELGYRNRAYASFEVSPGAELEVPSTNSYAVRGMIDGLSNEGTVRVTGSGTIVLKDCRKVGVIETPEGATVNFKRTIVPSEGRAPFAGEDLARLTLVDAEGTVYEIKRADSDYVYWDVDETADTALFAATFTVCGYSGASTLKDFPVLVRLSESRIAGFRYADCLTGGAGLRFCASDSDEEYPCDIESWNPSGESLVWVRLPELKAGTTFRLVYGNRLRTSVSSETWKRPNGEDARGGFAAVWHMASPSGTAVPDAADNGMEASVFLPSGSTFGSPSVAAGAVGVARQVSDEVVGAGPKLTVPKAKYTAAELGDTFTASVWVRADEVGDGASSPLDPRIFSCKSGSYGLGWEIEVVDNTATFNLRGSAGGTDYNQCKMPIWAANKWMHFTFVYNGAEVSAYQNGALVRTASIVNVATDPSTAFFYLGGALSGASLNGALDEARLMYGAASADWIAADYATQAQADFLSCPGVFAFKSEPKDVFSDTLSVSGVAVAADTACTLTVALLDAGGMTLNTKVLDAPSGALDYCVPFGDLTADTDYTVRLSLTRSDTGAIVTTRELSIRTLKRYELIANDAREACSLLPGPAPAGVVAHENNWKNADDGSILQYADGAFDYVSDKHLIRTQEGRVYPAGTTFRFAGKRLTVIGKGNETTPDDYGTLALKHDGFTLAIDRLVLRAGGCLAQCEVSYKSPVDVCLEVPEGEVGYLEAAIATTTKSFFNHVYGSVIGSGMVALQMRKVVNENCGAYFYNDWSAFAGRVRSVAGGTYCLLGDFKPAGDCAALTTDAILLDRANTVYIEKDVITTARTRGVTVAASGSLNLNIKGGNLLQLVYPFYGSGAVTMLDADYSRDATLRLCADEGDWTGTFTANCGTILLLGTKPLANGTLDCTGEACVELDLAAMEGRLCHLAAATPETRIRVKVPGTVDPRVGVNLLTTAAVGGLKKTNIVVDGLPAGVVLRSRVADGVRTYSVGRKFGLAIVYR